jgi:hypothetical protein
MATNENTEIVKEKRKSLIKAKKADRAMDNMFRITMNNHLQLSAMADAKANMMITVCALIMTLSLASINNPLLQPAILSMGLTCVVTILFAVYATLPKLPPRISGDVNLRGPDFNLIFFGYFSQLDFQTYLREMEQVVNNRSIVYESLAKDLYDLGRVLGKRKYRYIRISYQVFMVGLVISMVVLIVSFSTAQ